MSKKDEGQDRRRHPRGRFRDDDTGTFFAVRVADRELDIVDVHDVSISGIGLRLIEPLKIGQSVVLRHEAQDFQISVQGTVKWQKPASGEFCDFGVEFSSADMDTNILFFMSLRKYLDNFDDVQLKDYLTND